MGTYISVADTAKLIRKDLAQAFPGVKFSVRSKSYSGGASIDVHYTDGPTYAAVERIAKRYEGATFDGMTDYKGGVEHEWNGQRVHFGADFIFVRRIYTLPLVQKAIAIVAAKYGPAPCPVRVNDSATFGASIDCNDYHYQRWIGEVLGKLNAAGMIVNLKPTPAVDGPRVVRTY
jgi:hypothetical protein